MNYFLPVWLIAVNVFAFSLFGIDKRRAKQHKWRVSEKALFLSALLGGSVGAVAGMMIFHHKTLHRRFRWGLPLILVIQILAAGYICWKGVG